MSPDTVANYQIAVAGLLWSSAVIVSLDARKEAGRTRVILFAIAAVLGVLGCSVWALWNVAPVVTYSLATTAAFPPTWFFLLGAAYFASRAYWRNEIPAQPPEPVSATIYDDAELRRLMNSNSEILAGFARDAQGINSRMDALEKLKKQIVEDYQRMSGLEARFGDKIEGVQEIILGGIGRLDKRLIAVEARVETEAKAGQALNSLNADALRQQFSGVYSALAAIFHRERLLYQAKWIVAASEELRAPTLKGDRYDIEQWEDWQRKEHIWRQQLNEWCDLASVYSEGIRDKVLSVSEAQYLEGGVATADQFPEGTQAFIVYKAFCARWKNFRDWQGEAEREVHQAAFNAGGRRPFADPPQQEEESE